MLQNKIYSKTFLIEIFKIFLIILFGLSIIALTVRAVNFLDLIVDSGYSVSTYFQYSLLNLLGISVKFIPLAFLVSLSIFILKHLQDNEFTILWTSGVKKITVVKIFVLISTFIATFYLVFYFSNSFALNKSRNILNQSNFNSFLPTVKTQNLVTHLKDLLFLWRKKLTIKLVIFLFTTLETILKICHQM